MFVMRCERCGEVFECNEAVFLPENGNESKLPSCPSCGCLDLADGEICDMCGHFTEYDFDGICKECLMDEASDVEQVIEYGKSDDDNGEVTINGLFAYVYTPEEINDILMADFKRLPEEKQKEFTRRYVCNDEYCFADWLKEKEKDNGND